jgi:DNA-directed RNA polymerase specialized sigma24 family protein
MWPDDYDTWAENAAALVLLRTYQSVRLRPDPDAQAHALAVEATRNAFLAAQNRRQSAVHFGDERTFQRWLALVARRLALWGLVRDPAVVSLLDRLGTADHRILLWSYNDQLGDEQIAEILNTSSNRVRRLRRRALTALRHEFFQAGLRPDDWTWPP